MPMVSKAQNAAMYAAAAGKSTLGIPKDVGAKFVEESHGQAVKKLPQKVAAPTTVGGPARAEMARMEKEAGVSTGPRRRGGIDSLRSGDYRKR